MKISIMKQMNETNTNFGPEKSIRGRGKYFSDGGFEFTPEGIGGETLYQTVGKELKNGVLKKSERIYKASVKAKCDDPDPAASLREVFDAIIAPLEKQIETKEPPRAKIVGKTDHAVLKANAIEMQVVFSLRFDEINPDVAGLIDKMSPEQRKLVKVYLTPQDIITKEIAEVCIAANAVAAKAVKSR